MNNRKTPAEIAGEIIAQTIHSLPPEIRTLAQNLPLDLLDRPTPEMIDEEIDEETLGLFIGDSLHEQGESTWPMPAQIILFIGNIWEFSDRDPETFKEEVRITFLHELGHYLGWDEQDLLDRDLD